MRKQMSIKGFSKKSKEEKLKWVAECCFEHPAEAEAELRQYWLQDTKLQKQYDRISENTISNFILPFGIAPNFLINGKYYVLPMVIEESSVVAAAANAAKFWGSRGGFKVRVIDTQKVGQIHFYWTGNQDALEKAQEALYRELIERSAPLTENMEKRGGGIREMEIRSFSEDPDYHQFLIRFDTCDSMGANFINSILENYAGRLEEIFRDIFGPDTAPPEVLMSILSNYTPECIVRAEVSCPVSKLKQTGISGEKFAADFKKAVDIACMDPYRATTHNKGIFNGIDAVVLATGNDFRAIEAAGHTYAARDGQYRSLSRCRTEGGIFHFELELPLAVGTVGGLTHIHPLARRSLEMLGYPDAKTLMEIIAAAGLAQNFAAIRSLITTGIQKGHMKMHLINILNHLNATSAEIDQAIAFFKDEVISFARVRAFLQQKRADDPIPVRDDQR